MIKLFIIKTGSTFADTAKRYGDFDEITCRVLGIERDDLHVVDAFRGEVLPDPEDCHGVVITGAHGMVTDNLPWNLTLVGESL